MPLPRRHGADELLDQPAHDPAVLATSLDHVAAVNRWLGGRRALRRALRPWLRDGLRVLDIGTGSGDLPADIARFAQAHGVTLRITATDLHPQMAALATARLASIPGIEVRTADALALPFPDHSHDVAVLSLTLHHLDDRQAVLALREAARVAPIVIVNELHRARANYLGARLLAHTVWARNPLTRHDGPLSVLRAYTPPELRSLAEQSGLRVLELRREWFYRLVLTATPA